MSLYWDFGSRIKQKNPRPSGKWRDPTFGHLAWFGPQAIRAFVLSATLTLTTAVIEPGTSFGRPYSRNIFTFRFWKMCHCQENQWLEPRTPYRKEYSVSGACSLFPCAALPQQTASSVPAELIIYSLCRVQEVVLCVLHPWRISNV